ncbi:MAG: PEP/pyruvate-binding domain-containing protein, partial [Candidatus Thermoplasmatota archaeon]|nr:PEP/pyruvate-binding domain-containing protein [Candidatus Thermoplasmatota archaeon]
DDKSGTGVAFTRNPATGEKELYGEFLMNAQGEDIVSGKRTPQLGNEIYIKICYIIDAIRGDELEGNRKT